MLGSGRVFPIDESKIIEDPPRVQGSWKLIGGLDFGWDHPTAAVKLAWDTEADVVHVVAEYRKSEDTPIFHAAALRQWGRKLPWAWPHDGLAHDKGSGTNLAEQYKEQNLNMLPERSTFPDGKAGVEDGVTLMLDMMKTDRLKVSKHLDKWLEEFRMYHRKEGKIVKERDDLISATRYAIMMLRFAQAGVSSFDVEKFMKGAKAFG